jgi:topoisomerase-4 subunit A
MVDLDDGAEVVAALPYRPDTKVLIAGSDGRGFVAPADALVANTRKGKGVLGLDGDAVATVLVPADGDHVAVTNTEKLLLVFPIGEVAELSRGKGIRLQRCRSGHLAHAHVFKLEDGLPWQDGSPEGRLANAAILEKWLGHRAEVGLMMARSFPKFERFGK